MPKRSLAEQLDQAVQAMLERRDFQLLSPSSSSYVRLSEAKLQERGKSNRVLRESIWSEGVVAVRDRVWHRPRRDHDRRFNRHAL